jgi:hypothetical protein
MNTKTCNKPIDWLEEVDPFQNVYSIVSKLDRADRMMNADNALQFAFSIIADLLEEEDNSELEAIKNTLDSFEFPDY